MPLLAIVAAAALWLSGLPLDGHGHTANGQAATRVHCDRTASPRGSIRSIASLGHRLRPGQTGCVRAGYYRVGYLKLARRKITLRGYPGERATLVGRILIRGAGVRLVGLRLDGTASDGGHSMPSPTINAADVTISDSQITNRDGICIHPTAYGGLVPHRFRIERNRIYRCGRLPRTNHDHGIYVASGSGLVRGNVIYDNSDRGIQLYPSAHGVKVYSNTLDGNGEGINFGAYSSGNVVRWNVISGSRARWNVEHYALEGSGNQVSDNCLSPDAPSSYYRSNAGVQPGTSRRVALARNSGRRVRYVDRLHSDFRLASGSPCQGLGAPTAVAGR